jgi:hypothetical protein
MSDYYKRHQQGSVAAIRKEKLERIAALSQPYQDTMQVCLDGHKITGRYDRSPQNRRDHCATCGKPTIINCPKCGAKIKGFMWYPHVVSSDDTKVPVFCDSCGEPYPWSKTEEAEFLAADFGSADASKLLIDDDVKKIIQSRLDDAGTCLKAKTAMPVVFSCGSAVEGMLFADASNNQKLYNTAVAAPKDKTGKVKPLADWSLENLINVAKEVGRIGESAKNFAQPLRDFRNYIHPREQLKSGFNPDLETAKVCYQVTKLIISNLEQA